MRNEINLFNNTSRIKLKFIINLLLPEFKYVRINANGIVSKKKRWFSISKTRSSAISLILDEVIYKLHDYAELQLSQRCDFDELLKNIIRAKTDEEIIDKVYKFIFYVQFLQRIHYLSLPENTISIYSVVLRREIIQPHKITDLDKLIISYIKKLSIKRLPE